jgi:hypothetical protein
VSPTGPVTKDQLIAVTFYGPVAEAPTPPQPSAVAPPTGTLIVGQVATVTWTTYAGCPSGHPLTGYTFTVGGPGTPQQPSPLGASATSLGIDLTGPGTVTVNYLVQCTDLQSPASANTTFTVAAAPATG